ncbi:MAG: hypothetical protein ABIT04_05890 [Novosphingobium sp.]
MKRVLITPVDPPPAALAELKEWLAITTSQDDSSLTDLLRAGIETCEAFTGVLPIRATCEEILLAGTAWQRLATVPVQAITSIEVLSDSGLRSALSAANYAVELDADGGGGVRLIGPASAGRLVVTFTAGLAPDWGSLPDSLRHGIVRIAAHQYREREGSGAGPLPPASVAALWRPWRRLRLT